MANEITLSLSLSGYKSSVMSSAVSRSLSGSTFDMSGNYVQQGVMLVATSATVIPLGSVTAPHWCWLKNLDSSNFIRVRNGSGGADLLKLKAGEPALFPLYDSATPYAIADTASCLMEYLIFSL